SRVNGATATAASSGCSRAWWSASSPSVTITSARPATSSRKTLALSWWIVTAARGKWARAKASLAEPGLAMTLTPGRLIAAMLVKRSRSSRRHSGRLPSIKVGSEKYAFAARAGLTVTPPIAMSKRPARKSSSRVTQTHGTQSIATPSRPARSCAMSISAPAWEPSACLRLNGAYSPVVPTRITPARRMRARVGERSGSIGPFVPDAAVLDRRPGEQAAPGGDRAAVAVGQLEGAVAQFEDGDVGVGAGLQRADRAFMAENARRRGGSAQHDLVEAHAEMQQFRHGRRQIPDRAAGGAGRRQVGGDRIGQKALVERLFDHAEVEVVPAVGAVEDDAVALRLDHFLEHELFFLAHDAVGAAVIAVGDDVARCHLGENLGQRNRRIGGVDHQRHACRSGGLARQLDRRRGVFPYQARPVAQLDADRQVGVLGDGAGAAFRVGIGKMRQLAAARGAGDTDRRQVDEGAHPGPDRAVEDLAQPGEIGRAGAAGVAQRRHPGRPAEVIGAAAHVVRVDKDMGMDVDEARGYQQTLD